MPLYNVCGQDIQEQRVSWPLFLLGKGLWQGRQMRLVMWITCLFVVLSTTSAAAYVVQGPHAAELMIQALGRGNVLQVKQRIHLHDLSMKTNEREVFETATYLFPERFRSEIRAPSLHRIHIESKGRSITVIDNNITSLSITPLDHYKDLLLYRDRTRLLERLTATGVNTQVTSLGRFGDDLVVVIGARYPDENRPQIWLDKTSYRPLRWILRTDDHPEGPLEIHYLAWQKVSRQWFPRRIELYEDNTMVREIIVEQVLTKADIQPGDFDIDALTQQYATPSLRTPVETPLESDIERAIEDFRKQFEE
jgi:outer membrane lipoprotein-sorting protein